MRYNYSVVFSLFLFIYVSLDANSFEENCLSCHDRPMILEKVMYKYTLKYSSQKRIEEAIFSYLRAPSRESSLMPFGFLNRFGIKEASSLNDKELRESIRQYYEEYNIKKLIE